MTKERDVKNRGHLFCIFFLVSYANAHVQKNTSELNDKETWITVFVHGIMSIKPHLSLSNFIRFIGDNIQNTVYSCTVDIMRRNPIFYQNQAMQDLGLKKIDPHTVYKGNASGAMAFVYQQMDTFAYKDDIAHDNHYYTFGWSGLLSQTKRYSDAIELYKSLIDEVETFRSRGITPKVRIIGYSHGGNVVLCLALARQRNTKLPMLIVDEMVLLGMPVQNETDYLINDPMFKSIYHIYSRGDRIQKLDFFSCKRFFSARLFRKRSGFGLPEKLIQIQLKCTRNACSEKYKLASVDLYNFSNRALVSGKSKYLRDSSPGHSELWFFSWTPTNYRDSFPLNPLPAASLVPLIIREARNFQEKSWFEKPTLIDIRPEQEIVLVRNQKSKKILTVSQFLSRQEMRLLKEQVMRYKPDNYTQTRYNDAITTAYKKANKIRTCHHKMRRVNRKKRRRQQKNIDNLGIPMGMPTMNKCL